MDTTNLHINPTSGADGKSEKAKKIAGKAAQFVGAAGLGVAGTMAANAMNTDGEDSIEEIVDGIEVPTEDGATEELHAEPVTDFNPNDIMIEVDEVTAEDSKIETVEVSHETSHGDIAMVEPQPITGEVLIAEVDPTDDPYMNVEPDMYGGPDGWDDFDHNEDLLADNDDFNDDIDIADDILA